MLKRDLASRRDEEPVGGVVAVLVEVAVVVVGVVVVGEGVCASFSHRQYPGPWTGDP